MFLDIARCPLKDRTAPSWEPLIQSTWHSSLAHSRYSINVSPLPSCDHRRFASPPEKLVSQARACAYTNTLFHPQTGPNCQTTLQTFLHLWMELTPGPSLPLLHSVSSSADSSRIFLPTNPPPVKDDTILINYFSVLRFLHLWTEDNNCTYITRLLQRFLS